MGASIAATWSSLTFAHNYVQGERLSLPLALLRMGNFPEAPANKGVSDHVRYFIDTVIKLEVTQLG